MSRPTDFIFKTREAAVAYAAMAYRAYSDLRTKRMYGTCPIERAVGHIYIHGPMKRRCKDGVRRDFFSVELGA